MSHFTRIRTRLRSLSALARALTDLGYQPSVGNVAVRGWNGQRRRADLVVPMSNQYDFGFREVDGELVLIVDEWGFREDTSALLGRLTQRYAYHVCVEQAAAQGFQVVGEETLEDGSVKLTVQRYT